MQLAAAASRLGVADAMSVLEATGDDLTITEAAVYAARQQQRDRDRDFLEALVKVVQAGVARAFDGKG